MSISSDFSYVVAVATSAAHNLVFCMRRGETSQWRLLLIVSSLFCRCSTADYDTGAQHHQTLSVPTLAADPASNLRDPAVDTDDTVLLLRVRPVVRPVLGGGEAESDCSGGLQRPTAGVRAPPGEQRLQQRRQAPSNDQRLRTTLSPHAILRITVPIMHR